MVLGRDNDAVWMRWRPQEGTLLHLITLDGSKVRSHSFRGCSAAGRVLVPLLGPVGAAS